jgi:hypothetical protein
MKKLAKALLSRLPIDAVFAIVAIPAGLALRTYRGKGSARFPLTTGILRKLGVFPIIKHYYEPLFDSSLLKEPLSQDRNLPGLDLNIPGQLDFLSKLIYASELKSLNLEKDSKDLEHFYINNGWFESGDAEFLYQFIRATKPRKIIEIGSGQSTKIARLALKKNFENTNQSVAHICVEPYEADWLEKVGGIIVVRKLIEECEFDWSKELCGGDLLFVDSSHMIRPQGDVLKEYLEIFPLLASGVYIHIHDIFTPKDYLNKWICDDILFWNEQYLLEALLSNTNRYEIVGSLNHLKHHYYEELKSVCPYLNNNCEPASFYIRVR